MRDRRATSCELRATSGERRATTDGRRTHRPVNTEKLVISLRTTTASGFYSPLTSNFQIRTANLRSPLRQHVYLFHCRIAISDENFDEYIGSRKVLFRFQIGSRIFAKVLTKVPDILSMIHSLIQSPASKSGAFSELSKAHPALFTSFFDVSNPSQLLEALWGPLRKFDHSCFYNNFRKSLGV